VATAVGAVRFVIAKPIASAERRERQFRFVESQDAKDPALIWADDSYMRGAVDSLRQRLARSTNWA
jgi:hypothetical protein